jgi:hypothetical protein
MKLNLQEIEVVEASLDYAVYQMEKEPYASYDLKLKILKPILEVRTKIRAERKLKRQAKKIKEKKNEQH